MLDVVSQTVIYKSSRVKIEKGKVFGTTMHNPTMHNSWHYVPENALTKDLKQFIKHNNLG